MTPHFVRSVIMCSFGLAPVFIVCLSPGILEHHVYFNCLFAITHYFISPYAIHLLFKLKNTTFFLSSQETFSHQRFSMVVGFYPLFLPPFKIGLLNDGSNSMSQTKLCFFSCYIPSVFPTYWLIT